MKLLKIIFVLIFSIYYCKMFSQEINKDKTTIVALNKMWQTSDFWKVQTYDGHSSSGIYYAVDFYYNNRNRPDIYKNSDIGISGRPILACTSGSLFFHLLDVTTYGNGQFPSINAVRVFQGLDPVPQTCFSLTDSLGSSVRIDLSLIIDFSSNNSRTIYSHLQINSTYFNSTVQQKIRNAVRKFYNRTAVGTPRRVAISIGSTVSAGDQTGTMYNWGIASNYHLHFQLFNGSGYSESSPYLGTVQDLSNSNVVTIEGQKIFESSYQGNYGSGIYQFPAMMRRNFNLNDAIIVNTSWDGGSGANLRDNPGGNAIVFLTNGSTGSIKQIAPVYSSYNSNNYLWYKAQFGSNIGWIAAEYLDLTTAQQYIISCSANPSNGGITSGCGTFSSGQTITISASSNSGYNFVNWTEGGNPVSTNQNYTFTVTGNRTLVANFQQILLLPPVLVSPGNNIPPGPTIYSLTPNFQWQAVTGALRYGLYISISPYGYQNLIYQNENVTGTSFTLPSGYLLNNNLYRWNMTTFNSNGQNGNYSSPLYYQTYVTSLISLTSGKIPKDYEVYQNYPNPFNPKTTIKFDIPNQSDIKIVIYDLKGSEILKISKNYLNPGQYSFQFDGSNLSSGVYFCKFISKDFQKTIKLNYLK